MERARALPGAPSSSALAQGCLCWTTIGPSRRWSEADACELFTLNFRGRCPPAASPGSGHMAERSGSDHGLLGCRHLKVQLPEALRRLPGGRSEWTASLRVRVGEIIEWLEPSWPERARALPGAPSSSYRVRDLVKDRPGTQPSEWTDQRARGALSSEAVLSPWSRNGRTGSQGLRH